MHTRQGTRPRGVTAILGTMLGDGSVHPQRVKREDKTFWSRVPPEHVRKRVDYKEVEKGEKRF